jgi:hypothetical protein
VRTVGVTPVDFEAGNVITAILEYRATGLLHQPGVSYRGLGVTTTLAVAGFE